LIERLRTDYETIYCRSEGDVKGVSVYPVFNSDTTMTTLKKSVILALL
jgi:hypothetical protein